VAGDAAVQVVRAGLDRRREPVLDPNDCLALGGPAATPDFKWNPAATGLKSLYDAGKMAVIPAVDYLPPDLSHFHSRAFWQAGELDPNPATEYSNRAHSR
jgi:uncharacterized protein (DUF1501 family)